MTVLTLIVLVAAAYRLTRLVTLDDLTRRFRVALEDRFPGRHSDDVASLPVVFINCPWCVGVWVAAIAVALAWWGNLIHPWQLVVLAWLATATGAGFLSRLEA